MRRCSGLRQMKVTAAPSRLELGEIARELDVVAEALLVQHEDALAGERLAASIQGRTRG